MHMYYHIDRQWNLDLKHKLEDKDKNKYPDRIQGCVLVLASVNVKIPVDAVCHDLKMKGIHIYKPTQKKRSSSHCYPLGALDGLNLAGLEQALHHQMVEAEEYLIHHSAVSLQLAGDPHSVQWFSFRRNNEDCMSPTTYKRRNIPLLTGMMMKMV